MAIKDTLRQLMEAGREKEASDLIPHVDDSPPSQPGRWTAKDNLAHLSAWRLTAAAELEAVRSGRPAPASVSEDIDESNARVHEATRDQPAASVLADARSSWTTLAAAVEACSEEDLLKPRIRRPEQAAWQVIPGNTYFHISEHLGYWHDERGEPAQSEAAALWAHDLANKNFADDRQRGTAAYNLGCFYAVRGRAEEAIPHLRSGIELNPSLREWAKADSDLDSIRSTPELVRLLA
ncbi:MAG TPA: maleylpyruvate isomerase N-terminal domain-containing protein [Candidatus Dormibacteraeota bacterium]